jgi:hypothetical protein
VGSREHIFIRPEPMFWAPNPKFCPPPDLSSKGIIRGPTTTRPRTTQAQTPRGELILFMPLRDLSRVGGSSCDLCHSLTAALGIEMLNKDLVGECQEDESVLWAACRKPERPQFLLLRDNVSGQFPSDLEIAWRYKGGHGE